MSVFDTTQTTTTSLPSWYTDAQKDVAAKANAALSGATPFAQSAGATAAADLAGSNNPFMGAIGTLQGVASGAANPWLPSGQPNTNTALGGLFSAQNAQLNQLLPGITAKEGAAGIGGGGFGSLRGQTATQTARGGALTTLAAEQAKAALDAQTQAIQAGSAIGNIGSQYGTTAQNLANQQMTGNLAPLTKYQDILGSLANTLPKTAEQVTSPSKAQQLTNILGAVGANNISDVLKGNTGLGWLDSIIKGAPGAASNVWDSIFSSPGGVGSVSTGSTGTPVDSGTGAGYADWLNNQTDFSNWMNTPAGQDWLNTQY